MKLKKLLITTLCSLLIFPLILQFAACDKDNRINPKVDPLKTQLYVGNFNGGFGDGWLKEARTLFEEEQKDQVYEPGKKGVQIMIDNGKDEFGDALLEGIRTSREDVFVLDGLKYYDFVNAGHLLDITDVVTAGGDDSLENKMNPSLRDYYKTSAGKFFALPFYESFLHMIYDVDLFDEYNLWFNAAGTDFVKSKTEPRLPGQSGVPGAWDEGLPYTYSQFFKLLEEMRLQNIVGMTWTGQYASTYMPRLPDSFWADYQGPEQFAANYSLNGSIKTLKDYSFTEAPVGEFSLPSGLYQTETVNKTNAQAITPMSAGKYFALKLSHDIVSGRKYVKQDKVASPLESHLMAQGTFLGSRYDGHPIAMLVEGGWWYNEADVVMREMARDYGEEYSSMSRRFGLMPIPKADDGSSAPGRTFAPSMNPSSIIISKYTAKADLAKAFLKFIHTEESLRRFNVTTKVPRPFDYELTEGDLASMPYYAKNILAARKEYNLQFIVPRDSSLQQYNDFLAGSWKLTSRFDSADHGSPIMDFFSRQDYTAKQYFQGLKTYQDANPKVF